MDCAALDRMVNGWFVGDFEPSVLRTTACEVAVKHYRAGDREPSHHHKLAEEITVIVRGRARMGDTEIAEGGIAVIRRGESVVFEALEDTTTVVVKLPSVRGDKYLD
jgi:mannose-6-phosphate isomerase-like protein (cupin superfamily)